MPPPPPPPPALQVDIEDVDDAERALTLSNPVLEDLQKEASMMAALRHPNVVAFLGVCVNPPSVATEYCARGGLGGGMGGTCGPPSWEAAAELWIGMWGRGMDCRRQQGTKGTGRWVRGGWQSAQGTHSVACLCQPAVCRQLACQPCPSLPSSLVPSAAGSLTDVLRGGRANAAKAKQLDWARRINMVRGNDSAESAGFAVVGMVRRRGRASCPSSHSMRCCSRTSPSATCVCLPPPAGA